jgi:hypothetical protein
MNLPSGRFRITKAPGRMFFDNSNRNGWLESWSVGVPELNGPQRDTRDATTPLCNPVRVPKNLVAADVRRLTLGT